VRENLVVVVEGGIFIVFLVIGLAFSIGSLVIAIMAVVDASKYPDWAFEQAGTTKFIWQVLPIVLLFLCGLAGGIMGLIWYSSKRDAVARAAQTGGGAPYGYGAPSGGGPQPPPGSWMPPPAPPAYPPPPPPPPPYPPTGPPPQPSQ
jgi:hypothetical protein